jgi:hypothetical protein
MLAGCFAEVRRALDLGWSPRSSTFIPIIRGDFSGGADHRWTQRFSAKWIECIGINS